MNLLHNAYGSDNNDKRTLHHDIKSSISRMMTNARKRMPTDVFRDPFMAAEDENDIYNFLTIEVMTEKSV